jgi:dihydroorotase
VAVRAVEKAIALTKIYGTRLYILHTSTAAEIELIRAAKQAGLPVYAETTPHHLFLDTDSYPGLGGKAVVNPPLRLAGDRDALFAAIKAGVIDTIGSDHAPHTVDEKQQPYGSCPSGMPGIETTLPLLLTACHAGLLSLADVIRLTHDNPQKIFNLAPHEDLVFVDTNTVRAVKDDQLATRCRWSAFAGRELRGWPVYVVLAGKLFDFRF